MSTRRSNASAAHLDDRARRALAGHTGREKRVAVKKTLIVLGVIAGAVLVAKRIAPKMGDIDWEKRFDSMPDSAPPKWMFRNISEIHDNTERILRLLEGQTALPEDTSIEPSAR
jgi:hypothetical protein